MSLPLSLNPRGAHHFQRFRGHLGTDPVASDDSDPVGHAPILSHPLPGTKKPPTDSWTVESERRSGVRLQNDDYVGAVRVAGCRVDHLALCKPLHRGHKDRGQSHRCQFHYGA